MQLPNTIPLSALRQLTNWIVRPYDFFDECARNYGDTFTIKLVGFPPLVFLSAPQSIKEIFATDAKQFDAGRSNGILSSLLGSNSLRASQNINHPMMWDDVIPKFKRSGNKHH